MTTLSLPPTSVETYEFSYSRSKGKMRFRLNGDEWNVKRIAGKAYSEGVNELGQWMLRLKLKVDGDTAYTYLPKDVTVEDFEIPEGGLPDTHWRLCYNRAGSESDKRPHWRLRDERTQHVYSNDIRDYKGIINLNWMDGGPHVFHDGKVYIDDEGVAHFAP